VSADTDRFIRLGEICGVYGIKGWVKLLSFTDPRGNLLQYPKWLLERGDRREPFAVEASREGGKILTAKLAGIDDREAAAALMGAGIVVPRESLPECAPGEYYWADLVGLSVQSRSGEHLGRVERLIATGANDVLVLDGDGGRMIPFVQGDVVIDVDLAGGVIVVDWDRSYWE
jgi:16S rRNA processing protein RimM